MNPRVRKVLLISAEVALVLVIVGLIVANWLPVIIGARTYRPTTP
jgi:hypothetical protein